jgi:hypothetical protein
MCTTDKAVNRQERQFNSTKKIVADSAEKSAALRQRTGTGRKIAYAILLSAAGRAQGIAAESPQEAHWRFRGLGAESPVFWVCEARPKKCAQIFSKNLRTVKPRRRVRITE